MCHRQELHNSFGLRQLINRQLKLIYRRFVGRVLNMISKGGSAIPEYWVRNKCIINTFPAYIIPAITLITCMRKIFCEQMVCEIIYAGEFMKLDYHFTIVTRLYSNIATHLHLIVVLLLNIPAMYILHY